MKIKLNDDQQKRLELITLWFDLRHTRPEVDAGLEVSGFIGQSKKAVKCLFFFIALGKGDLDCMTMQENKIGASTGGEVVK